MSVRTETAAVINALDAAGLNVGDHVAPRSPNGRIVAPCVVVYTAMSPMMRPSIAGGRSRIARWRIVSTAITPAEALEIAATTEAALHDQVLTPTAGSPFRVRLQSTAGIERDDTADPPLYYVSALYSAPL